MDGVAHAFRDVLRPVAVEQPAAQAGQYQHFSSHRLVPSPRPVAAGGPPPRPRGVRHSSRRPHAGEQRPIGAGRQQRQHPLLFVVVPPSPRSADSRTAGRCRGCAPGRRRQAGQHAIEQDVDVAAGIRIWLESMNSTSPAWSPAKASVGAACRSRARRAPPAGRRCRARGIGRSSEDLADAAFRPGKECGRMARADSTMRCGLRSRTSA